MDKSIDYSFGGSGFRGTQARKPLGPHLGALDVLYSAFLDRAIPRCRTRFWSLMGYSLLTSPHTLHAHMPPRSP